jgi:hypothetical protein
MNAVYGIANAGVSRGLTRSSALSPATVSVVYVAACTLGGTATGALLGALGGVLPANVRAATATALALLAIGAGLAALSGRHIGPPLQCDRETPRDWVDRGRVAWAVRNGLALGFGGSTRIGFAAWYAIGLGALLTGSWLGGAIIYGVYGLTRGAGAWVAMAAIKRTSADRVGLFMMKRYQTSIELTTAQMLMLGVAVLVAVGA